MMSSCQSCIAAGRCQPDVLRALLAPRARDDEPVADRGAVPRRARRQPAPAAPAPGSGLMHDPLRAPLRMRAPQIHRPAPQPRGKPARETTAAAASDRPARPTPPPGSAAPTHAPTGATRPPRRPTSLTTCSIQDSQHRSIPLVDNRQHHERNPGLPVAKRQQAQPITAGVKRRPRLRCKASTETGHELDARAR